MATDIERLIVSLEASTTKYERALMKANGETEKRVRDMQRRFDGLSATASRMESRIVGSFGTIGRAFGVMGVALTTTSIISMTSAWTDLNSRVQLAAGSMERGTAVMSRLSEMARRTYSSLEQTAEGYLQNQQALSALGYSTQQQLDLVETLNNSLVISAVRGQRAQSVMDAWSKAMASGSLRGDNLNTIIQSGGRLSKALADSMGVSVNELRRMGEEGRITTDVMFGVTSQLETLRLEADSMPATVSDGFVLLRDAVMQFVGEADKAVGSSSALAEALISISDAIKEAPESHDFDRFFKFLGDGLAEFLEEGAREIEFISNVVDALSEKDPADVFVKLNEAMGGNIRTAEEYELALADAEQALANFAVNTRGRFGEADAAVQDLFAQMLRGRGTVELATAAVEELAKVNPDFAALKDGVLGMIETFFAFRDAAVEARTAAANITTDIGYMPTMRQMNRIFGPDLSDDGAPGGPIKPPVRPTGGRGGQSPAQRYGDSIEQFQRRIDMLKQETALTAALNPLINDYGYAKERLKAIQELENAAIRAGISLGAEQRAQIESLADAYATATADAARLAEAQNLIKQSADEMAKAGRQALDTIIDGFLEGKSAGEIFNSVLKDLARNLLNMGLNLIGGGMQTGGFNPLGFLGSLMGFASGTPNTGGRRGEPRGIVHGQEAVIPLPNGGRVPVDLRLPSIPSAPAASGGEITVTGSFEVINGNLVPVVSQISGRVAGQQIKQNNKQLPALMRDANQRMG
ncbi:tape measure protein [Devosia elaeis]|uniref:Tape measure protein N-terminal domain-containing protein n=1 Tax=Devosia elaeis TaxID=1770058 RepID=A0A178HY04_9HYPH|nr:tape measure protein [Devosia elaeis]OAM77693.1 hypothetical protein A3840_08665 [Devosia elaeis]